jgi:ABC-type branched-subunit amino acid transport system ATPase component
MPQELSAGQRKLVGAARAIAGRPRMLLMDEPAAGLDTVESRAFAGRLRAVRDTGITVLLVDHDMGLVLDVCDYIYVIDFGVKIAEGTAAEITMNQRVVDSYLGAPGIDGRFG